MALFWSRGLLLVCGHAKNQLIAQAIGLSQAKLKMLYCICTVSMIGYIQFGYIGINCNLAYNNGYDYYYVTMFLSLYVIVCM